MLPIWQAAVVAIIGMIIAGAVCFQGGVSHRRKTAEAKIGSAEDEAKRLINDAIKTAEQKRKEALLEAKDEIFKMKAEGDKELKERRGEISRQERRISQKEEALDKKTENIELKEQDAKQKQELILSKLNEIEQM
ncbi:MAG: Rnase Y domain-containing protein, partial [Oscillospiraceae bacterium]